MIEYRGPKGRIQKGSKMPEEIRKKISEGQMRRYKLLREQGFYHTRPATKQCSKCKQTKKVPDDFHMAKRKLKSGEFVHYPVGRCYKCTAEASAAWREKRRSAGLYKDDLKRYHQNRDQDKYRQWSREYQTIQRRKEGMKIRGPWKKYRESSRSDKLKTEPFSRWLVEIRDKYKISNTEIAKLSLVDEKRIRNILKCAEENITSDLVERIAHAIDPWTHLSDIYPDLYE